MLGPLMLGLQGCELSAEERELLRHPLVGGVILFTRNYHDPQQLRALTQAIGELRQPRLLVTVDQEGGRVQRFREGFTRLPPVRRLGAIYDRDRRRGLWLARLSGWLMAIELRACGVDSSFAPVLDLDRGLSTVIGERAFHFDPQAVAALAGAYVIGMGRAGMEATGKHFPGHGSVRADSHCELPEDPRELAAISAQDLQPFAELARRGIAAIMAAHVRYPQVAAEPASFSPTWLREVLRHRLGFQGLVLSDDLDMLAAAGAGTAEERAAAALRAGCDLVLACNDRAAACHMLDHLPPPVADPVTQGRLLRMHGRGRPAAERLQASRQWRRAVAMVSAGADDPLADRQV